jgi:hypothetical protein
VASGRTSRAGADPAVIDAGISAKIAGATDILSGAERGIRRQDRTGLECSSLGPGVRDAVRVAKRFLDGYAVQSVGGREHQEYWIPAEHMTQFNAALIGEIEIVAEFP